MGINQLHSQKPLAIVAEKTFYTYCSNGQKMHSLGITIVLILFLFLATGCTKKIEEEKTVLAQVGSDTIYLGEFEEEFATARSKYGSSYPVEKEAALKLKAAFLKQIIDERIIIEEGKRLAITIGNEEVDAAISEIKKNYSDSKAFEEMLIREYVNLDRWKENIKRKLFIDKVITQTVLNKVKISPKEIKAHYTSHQKEFHREEQVKASQILLREETNAVKARERIRVGEDFATVAKEVSLSPDSAEGGDLGFFSRGIMPPEFDEVVFTIKVDMLSEVVESPYGFHIFLVEDKRGALDLSMEEAETQIIEVLKRAKMDEVYMKWIETVKKEINVKIDENVLKRSMGIK